MSYILGYDPDTLREQVDVGQCTERLSELGEQRSLPAMMERVWLLKVLGKLDEALPVAEHTVRLARMGGTRRDLVKARMLHATILQFRGAYAAAIQELSTCVDEAEGQKWNALLAFALQHRGKVHYDAGELGAARADFRRALDLRRDMGAPEDELTSTIVAIEATERRRTSVA